MFKKIVSTMIVILSTGFLTLGNAVYAQESADPSLTHGAASLVVPGLGQYLNDEMGTRSGKIKTGMMVILEIGGIVTTILLGTLVGAPVVWAGVGILVFNHLWSAADAYSAFPVSPEVTLMGDDFER